MIAEAYLKKRYQDGITEGEQMAHSAWTVWNEKRLKAEAKGQPFDEPPPTLNEQNGQCPK